MSISQGRRTLDSYRVVCDSACTEIANVLSTQNDIELLPEYNLPLIELARHFVPDVFILASKHLPIAKNIMQLSPRTKILIALAINSPPGETVAAFLAGVQAVIHSTQEAPALIRKIAYDGLTITAEDARILWDYLASIAEKLKLPQSQRMTFNHLLADEQRPTFGTSVLWCIQHLPPVAP